MSSHLAGLPAKEGDTVDIYDIDKRTAYEIDALERSWFVACRTAEAARAELQKAGLSESAARTLAEIVARLESAERQKHEIMRQINALEDSLVD
jgi:predicted transcriptional regulator